MVGKDSNLCEDRGHQGEKSTFGRKTKPMIPKPAGKYSVRGQNTFCRGA